MLPESNDGKRPAVSKERRRAGRFVFFSRRPRASFARVGNSIAESGPGERRHLRLAVPSARRRHGLLSNTGLSGREKMVSSKRLKHSTRDFFCGAGMAGNARVCERLVQSCCYRFQGEKSTMHPGTPSHDF